MCSNGHDPNHHSGMFITHITVFWRLVCGDVISFVYLHISNSTNHLQHLLFLTPAAKIMWCLSTNLFTGSKFFFFFFLNDRMQNGAHQQHSQTLQSVTVVSVLEQERGKKQRQETGVETAFTLRSLWDNVQYWHTIVSCESKNLRLQLYHGHVIALLSVCGKMMSLPISCVFGIITKNHTFC